MATLTLSVNSIATGPLSKTYTVSEADMATWFAALRAAQLGSQGLSDPLTAEAWADSVMAAQVLLVQNYQAAQAAAAVKPINVT